MKIWDREKVVTFSIKFHYFWERERERERNWDMHELKKPALHVGCRYKVARVVNIVANATHFITIIFLPLWVEFLGMNFGVWEMRHVFLSCSLLSLSFQFLFFFYSFILIFLSFLSFLLSFWTMSSLFISHKFSIFLIFPIFFTFFLSISLKVSLFTLILIFYLLHSQFLSFLFYFLSFLLSISLDSILSLQFSYFISFTLSILKIYQKTLKNRSKFSPPTSQIFNKQFQKWHIPIKNHQKAIKQQ